MKNSQSLINSAGQTYVTVYFDESLGATVDVWTGRFETEENFKAGLALVLESVKTNQCDKWLADLSQIDGNFDFAQPYILNYIIPEAMRSGLRYEALVLPNNIFAMLSVQETMEKMDTPLRFQIFGDVEKAKMWLRSK